MTTSLAFKPIIDLPLWRPESPAIAASAAGASLCADLRNDSTKHPNLYWLRSNVALDMYDTATGEWLPLASPGLSAGLNAGALSVFHPSQGPRSKILAGATATTLPLDGLGNGAPATATWARAAAVATITQNNHGFQNNQVLTVTVSSDIAAIVLGTVTITVTGANNYTFPCLNAGAVSGTLTIGIAVGINQLANRGDGTGYRIRVIGLSVGKVEERTIMGNSGLTTGANPTVTLDSALSFTPAAGDLFEILSGRIFMLCPGNAVAGQWKYYDIATNTFSGNLGVANLPNVSTDSSAIALSEQHVPSDRKPGEGFLPGGATNDGKNAIQATAATATTIVGSGLPADLFADEYRNFQVRVVSDLTNPTAVGQRRRISIHTAGATPTLTVAAWTVTPSAVAKFVIENDDDKILMRSTANTNLYTFIISANTWDTTTFGVAANAVGAGCVLAQAFGIARDANARNSHIFCIRGGNVAAIDVLDIAGGSNGVWQNGIVYGNQGGTLFTTGNNGCYDPVTSGGRFMHLNVNGTQRFLRFDLKNRILDPETYLRYPQGGVIAGKKVAFGLFVDGTTKLAFMYHLTHSQQQFFSIAIQ